MIGYSMVRLVPRQEAEWDPDSVVETDEEVDDDVADELRDFGVIDYVICGDLTDHDLLEIGIDLEDDEPEELEV